MSGTMRYTVRRDAITHETIDGEAVILNLETGCYYSLVRSAAEIWGLLGDARSAAEIAAALAAAYRDAGSGVGGDVERFLEELVREGLAEVFPANGNGARPPAAVGAAPSGAYAPPAVERFDDLKDLLLLDPVHDVAESGWPRASRGDAAA